MVTKPLLLIFQDGSPVVQVQARQDLSIPAGIDVTVPFQAETQDGKPKDLTGYTLTLTARANGPTGAVKVQLAVTTASSAAGQITSPVTGLGQFLLTNTVTDQLNGSYPYDVFSTSGAGLKDNPLPSSFLQVTQTPGMA